MKFSVPQSNLSAAIALAAKATTKNGTIPALANILLTADIDTLTLVGYDGDCALSATVETKVERSGSLAVPAMLWGDLTARMPAQVLEFEVEESTLKMSCGKIHFNVGGTPADEFPEITNGSNGQPIKVTAETLLGGIEKVLLAIADHNQPQEMLKSVHLLATEETLELASTDGHRLAVIDAESGSQGAGVECSIPGKSMAHLANLLKRCDPTELVELYIDEDPVQVAFFGTSQGSLTARITEGEYPSYRKLIPTDFASVVQLSASTLRSALERVAVFASFKNDEVRISLVDGVATVAVPKCEMGNASETLSVKLEGKEIAFAAKSKYLIDGLKAVAAETIEMMLNGPTKAIVMRPAGGTGKTYLFMPIQIRE